jgi:hypothetical protein
MASRPSNFVSLVRLYGRLQTHSLAYSRLSNHTWLNALIAIDAPLSDTSITFS